MSRTLVPSTTTIFITTTSHFYYNNFNNNNLHQCTSISTTRFTKPNNGINNRTAKATSSDHQCPIKSKIKLVPTPIIRGKSLGNFSTMVGMIPQGVRDPTRLTKGVARRWSSATKRRSTTTML
jgi:hypothetical protein